MEREYNPFEFDSPDPNRSNRIEREVAIVKREESRREEEEERERERDEREGSERERKRERKRKREGENVDESNSAKETPEGELTPEQQEELRRIAREKSVFWQFISGNWMILDGVTGTYRYLLIIASTLFLSVVSIFVTFHLSEKLTLRTQSVQLLRERALEYQRIRFNSTSHSAIVKELERRGIPLYDLHESKTIIE
ncbi:MAG: hypothetical protein SNI51_00670 [Rikenellaceae bacterium]